MSDMDMDQFATPELEYCRKGEVAELRADLKQQVAVNLKASRGLSAKDAEIHRLMILAPTKELQDEAKRLQAEKQQQYARYIEIVAMNATKLKELKDRITQLQVEITRWEGEAELHAISSKAEEVQAEVTP